MKKIKLTQGQVTWVSDEDYKELSQYKWHAYWAEHTQSYYARRTVRLDDGTVSTVMMHRQIMGFPKGKLVDHIDHDTLNNTRWNLRNVTKAQSEWNTRMRRSNKLGEKHIHCNNGRYVVAIRANGVLHRQSFKELDEARSHRDCMRDKMHGEFAYLGGR